MTTRAPRKYLDKDRTEVSPEWVQWREAQTRTWLEGLSPAHAGMYFPEDQGKAIPDEGAWIRVIEVPYTELDLRFKVPVMSMWRARPTQMNSGSVQGNRPKLAVIDTPGGELHLWAHEYSIVGDIREWIGQEPEVLMHQMSGAPMFGDDDEQRLFYLQSRGLSRVDAAMLLLNDLHDTKFAYFTFHPDIVEMWGGVGMPLWRHIQLNPRTPQPA